MNIIQSAISAIRLGPGTTFQNMTVFPVLSESGGPASCLTLDEALAGGGFRVTEVSDHGEVANLKATNTLEQPVLLLDGEEVVGAKQNRIFNLSILVPAKSELVVPVSCVEAGRWRHASAEFKSAPRTQYAAGRHARMAQVSDAMSRAEGARSDQGEVWANIAGKQRRLGVDSETRAMADMYGRHAASVDQYVAAFSVVDGQAGALFALSDGTVGLDLFDSPGTLGKLFPKLVRSYALDAIEAPPSASPGPASAAALLDSIRNAAVSEFDAIGLGTDLRLQGAGVRGAALAWEERILHLCAFNDSEPGARPGAGMARASRRGRPTSPSA